MTPTRRVLTEKRALIWPLAVVLLANVLLFALVVYPLSKKVAGGEQEAEASALALSQARREHAAARATVAGKGQADEELQKFYRDVLPPDLSGARRLTFLRIDQLAKETGLRLRDQRSETRDIRDSALRKLTITVALAGDYREIRRFLYELETAPDFLVIENVELSQPDENAGAIDVTVQIATYFRADGHGAD
jgi:Tfp pilus assembly protein PilO